MALEFEVAAALQVHFSASDLGAIAGLSPAPEGWREEDDEDADAAGLELGLELELERELEGLDADFCFLADGGLVAGVCGFGFVGPNQLAQR